MKNRNREIVLLLKHDLNKGRDMEKELERLDLLLSRSESVELFCISHELVKRDYITRKTSILKKAYFKEPEKPFWFLISKN